MKRKMRRPEPSPGSRAVQQLAGEIGRRTSQRVVTRLPESRWEGELTNSARQTFLHCRKKFEWQYLRRLSPRAPHVPFLVGGLVHAGLEDMYRRGDFREAWAERMVTEACEGASKTAGLAQKQSDRIWQQRAMVMGILRGYAAHYLEADLKKWEVLEAEVAFRYALPKPTGWAMMGKRDMVVRRRKDGAIGLVEHKTAAVLSADYIAKLPLDAQIIGYANALRKARGKLPDFVVYNVIKKSGLRQRGNEPFRSYLKRVELEYSASPANYFYRETLSFGAADIRAYEEELNQFAPEMDRAIRSGYLPKNTGHCTAMGVCPYMRLCIEGPTRENLVMYEERAAVHAELEDQKDEGGMR